MSLDLAREYVALGWPVFPARDRDEEVVDPETGEVLDRKAKEPLTPNGLKAATKLARLLDRWWGDNPSAMVGIPTGEKIGAFVLDVDIDEGKGVNGYLKLEELEAEHGPLDTRYAKTPRGGTHFYFRHVPGITNSPGLLKGTGIDVRGDGGFVIAPGSYMADGRSYEWQNPGAPIAEAPQWLLDLINPPHTERPAATHTAVSYSPPKTNDAYIDAAVDQELARLSGTSEGGRGYQLNASAFSLGQLVGAGVVSRNEAESGLYAAAASNGLLAKDGERSVWSAIRRGLNAGQLKPREIPEQQFDHDDAPAMDMAGFIDRARRKLRARIAMPVDEYEALDEDEKKQFELTSPDQLASLTSPPGLVGEMVDWIVSSAEQPSRELALAATLPFLGALMGGRYGTGTRDTRTNIYTVALAESGFGKDHARGQIKRIFMPEMTRGVLDRFSGPARIMSASALREILEANPSIVSQIDEFGGFVREITDRRAGAHQRAISTDLRDYYSAASTYFEGAAYRGSPPKRIYNPNLCIHGTSTPEQFWSALSSASAEDGLLPRLVLFDVVGPKPKTVKPQRAVDDAPEELRNKLLQLVGWTAADEFSKIRKAMGTTVAGTAQRVHSVPWSAAAQAKFAANKERIEELELLVDAEARPFMRRVIENSVKLALICAVGMNIDSPIIDEEAIDWGGRLAFTCACSMVSQVSERLSDNEREAHYKKIAGMIRGAGERGITEGRLGDRLKGIDRRRRDEILADLKLAGRVVQREFKTGGRKAVRLVWVDLSSNAASDKSLLSMDESFEGDFRHG